MPSDALPDDPETLKAMLLAELVQNERLRQIIKELQRHRFGRRAETLPEDQMLLGIIRQCVTRHHQIRSYSANFATTGQAPDSLRRGIIINPAASASLSC